MRALVVGGGIGGLATGIALQRVGIDALVLEQAPALEHAGFGLALAANAMRALDKLELGDAVRERGARADRLLLRTWKGRVLTELDLGAHGIEMVGCHRADLQAVLRAEAGDAVRLGARASGVREEGADVVVDLAEGTEERGDVLVGADGIDSVVRRHLHGSGEKRYAGHAAWRASAAFDDESLRGTMTESWGRDARFGLLPIGSGQLYWFVAELASPGAPTPPEGAKAAFLHRFADWHEPIAAALRATDESAISKTDVYDRKPLETWGRGRITLLGDAAHPMTPNLGQGAALALEDAVVLAGRLAETDDADRALRAYEARRIPRTSEIVRRSWQLGRLAQVRSPLGRPLRDGLMRFTPTRVQLAQQEHVLGVDLD